jgi:hypothetical protein
LQHVELRLRAGVRAKLGEAQRFFTVGEARFGDADQFAGKLRIEIRLCHLESHLSLG